MSGGGAMDNPASQAGPLFLGLAHQADFGLVEFHLVLVLPVAGFSFVLFLRLRLPDRFWGFVSHGRRGWSFYTPEGRAGFAGCQWKFQRRGRRLIISRIAHNGRAVITAAAMATFRPG